VASHLAQLARGDLTWPDVMRLLGAYAATNRWHDALDELRRHRSRWHAAPELFYMEAVALAHLGDDAAAARHCRAVLNATRGTRHPERAYWAARACLVRTSLVEGDRNEVEERVGLGNLHLHGDLGRADLQGAWLLRSGRPVEAFTRLRATVTADSRIRSAVLWLAAAAAQAGRRTDARAALSRADAIPRPTVSRFLGPWIERESDGIREETLRVLHSVEPSRRQGVDRSQSRPHP
jgi:hypothetical protein